MRNRTYTGSWETLAPLGLVLIGFGLSLTGEAMRMRTQKKGFLRWFLVGTIGLSVLNAGISVFGDAVKRRALREVDDALAADAHTTRI
ncbi:MAG: hypothetical protein OHK0023_05150 [Anaerolineae bacterium]